MTRAAEWRRAHPEETRPYAVWYREVHREKRNAASRAWRLLNPEKQKAAHARWLAANPEYKAQNRAMILATQRGCRANNPAPYRAATQKYKAANPSKVQALGAKRRAAKLRRTPPWVDLQKIQKIYEEARVMTLMLGEPWHVDHVIPLCGRRVSGLHVHTNLQLLPGVENLKKLNSYAQ